jgi:hypothetical protein
MMGGVFLMRVALPDRPGSLGAVATALGTVGADINAVEIVEKNGTVVVDDFIVDLPNGQLPEIMVSACEVLDGVRVEWISRYPEGGGLQSDLEALERMTADPPQAAETLASMCPVVFRSHWAMLLDVAGDRPRQLFGTPLAPVLGEQVPDGLAPFDQTRRVDLSAGWLDGWGESTVVITPVAGDRAIIIGRHGGPPFLDSEIARLNHLAGLVK